MYAKNMKNYDNTILSLAMYNTILILPYNVDQYTISHTMQSSTTQNFQNGDNESWIHMSYLDTWLCTRQRKTLPWFSTLHWCKSLFIFVASDLCWWAVGQTGPSQDHITLPTIDVSIQIRWGKYWPSISSGIWQLKTEDWWLKMWESFPQRLCRVGGNRKKNRCWMNPFPPAGVLNLEANRWWDSWRQRLMWMVTQMDFFKQFIF